MTQRTPEQKPAWLQYTPVAGVAITIGSIIITGVLTTGSVLERQAYNTQDLKELQASQKEILQSQEQIKRLFYKMRVTDAEQDGKITNLQQVVTEIRSDIKTLRNR